MRVELLRAPGCAHAVQSEALVRDVLRVLAQDAALEITELASLSEPAAARFAGSPTIRVNGVDLEPDAAPMTEFG